MRRVLAWLAIVVASALTAACGSESPPGDAPTGVTVTPGDGSAIVSWNQDGDLDYWIFYGEGTSIEYSSRASLPGYRSLLEVQSPQVVPALKNGTAYAFIVAGSKDGSEVGPASVSISVTPRPAGADWNVGAPLAVASLGGVASNGIAFVTVGAGGTVFSSPDAITWTAQTSATGSDLNAVRFVNGRYIAVGAGGAVIFSYDGIGWTAGTSGTTETLHGLGDFNGLAVAVGANGTILTSGDGMNWTPVASGTSNTLYAADTGNGRIVAAGAGGTVLSSDNPSASWQAVASPTAAELRGVRYGANTFSVVGAGGTALWSADGLSFATATTPANADLRAIAFGSQFAAVGAGGAVFTSADGQNWVAATSGVTADLRAIVFGLYRFSAVGGAGTNLTAR